MTDKERSAFITQSEAARMLGVSRQRVNHMAKTGKIKTYSNIANIPLLYFDEIEELAKNKANNG